MDQRRTDDAFFFVIALELKRQIVLGELRNPRFAVLPIAAAIGGMVVPAAVFLLVLGGHAGASGWGAVMSTDTAIVVACLAALGSRIPASLRVFLLSAAIFDDIGAILVVAIGYGNALHPIPLVLGCLGFAIVAVLARAGVRSVTVYTILGLCIWLAFDHSGIHATLVGVILGLFTPTNSWVSAPRLHAILTKAISHPLDNSWLDPDAREELRQVSVAAREALSPIEQLELTLHPWVAFAILPAFAIANAGVPVVATEDHLTLMAAIAAAFVLGKPLGLIAFSFLAVRSGIAVVPAGLSWGLLAAGGLLSGAGFTMALFIAEVGFADELLNSVKLGILAASTTSVLLGLLSLVWLTRGSDC